MALRTILTKALPCGRGPVTGEGTWLGVAPVRRHQQHTVCSWRPRRPRNVQLVHVFVRRDFQNVSVEKKQSGEEIDQSRFKVHFLYATNLWWSTVAFERTSTLLCGFLFGMCSHTVGFGAKLQQQFRHPRTLPRV